ncbi:hypothetical protein TNCV_4279091 [Trichonephila clavipes]|nr:hypothetical protein TNCV_4279091 [Trichonephila clavipes]
MIKLVSESSDVTKYLPRYPSGQGKHFSSDDPKLYQERNFTESTQDKQKLNGSFTYRIIIRLGGCQKAAVSQ